jgi:hypothetical protein
MSPNVVKVFLASLLLAGVATGKQKATGTSPFAYCGGWRGHHIDSNRIGTGTAQRIAPTWAITAAHLAKPKALTPDKRNIEIRFGPDKSARLKKAYLAPQGDLGLVQFNKPLTGINTVGLLNRPLTIKVGVISFTMVGYSGGLHFYRDKKAKRSGLHARHITTKKNNPCKVGDSEGGWVIEDAASGRHTLFAIIHGGGLGTQPAAVRKWMDDTMKGSGGKAPWDALPKSKKRKSAASKKKRGESPPFCPQIKIL